MPASKSFLDKAMATAKDLGEKAKDTAVKNSDKIESAVDKTADFVDRRTRGRYTKHVSKAHGAARDAVGKLSDEKRRRQGPTDEGPGTAV